MNFLSKKIISITILGLTLGASTAFSGELKCLPSTPGKIDARIQSQNPFFGTFKKLIIENSGKNIDTTAGKIFFNETKQQWCAERLESIRKSNPPQPVYKIKCGDQDFALNTLNVIDNFGRVVISNNGKKLTIYNEQQEAMVLTKPIHKYNVIEMKAFESGSNRLSSQIGATVEFMNALNPRPGVYFKGENKTSWDMTPKRVPLSPKYPKVIATDGYLSVRVVRDCGSGFVEIVEQPPELAPYSDGDARQQLIDIIQDKQSQ